MFVLATMFLRVCIRALVGLSLALGALPAQPAAVRTGEAEVRESNGGVPCFTIAEREERRTGAPSFQAIRVSAVPAGRRATMWAMAMPPARTFPLMFSMCIPYAGRVPSLPQENAELLEAGKLYEVVIEVRPGDAPDGPKPDLPKSYVGRFCLARKADGSNAVKMLGAAARSAAACAPDAPPSARGKARGR
ncbi:MAG: hypothetical protein JWP59_646 [Massilia sp.]|nr:hypothetical protein [Massilia sp.]